MNYESKYATIKDICTCGLENLPDFLQQHTHLIYSSPATLAFNSPGAEGFGVKRAGLAIPGSVMLIVSPACCGRNTSVLSHMKAYHDRFYYLTMDETDIVTGRHLKHIPEAVKEICDSRDVKPSVVMICITCVDALLGTDMERVCQKAAGMCGIPVRPCYMYALTREGRKPPMVLVRQTIYSLLKPLKRRSNSVNILGYFAPLQDDCELYRYLKTAGVRRIREISRCADIEEYHRMAEANFNLVLHPESRYAADDLNKRLGIPYIELRRLYQIDKIHSQYGAFAKALGIEIDDTDDYEAAAAAIESFKIAYPETVFAVGEWSNADPFELALALTGYGFKVAEIFGTVTTDNFTFIRALAMQSPETKVYANTEPTMLYYANEAPDVTMTVGKDAGFYHKDCPNVLWNEEIQPFGYAGVTALFGRLKEAAG